MKKNKVSRTINLIKNIICWMLVVILVLTLIVFFISRINGSTPSVFGYSIYRVSSGSMEPELMVGDVILGKEVSDATEIKAGDIVTYKGSGGMSGELITHEVIVAPTMEDGKLMLQTQGVANDIPDEPIEADRVVSVMVMKLPFMNKFYNFFLSPWGLLIIIGLIILVFIDELIVFIKSFTGTKSADESENINEIIERLQAEQLEKEVKEKEAKEKEAMEEKQDSEDKE